MTPAHTPGNWEVGDEGLTVAGNPNGEFSIITKINGRKRFVATAHGPSGLNGTGEAEANARLIAAAPATTEALRRVRRYCPVHEQDAIDALLAQIDGVQP